MKQVSIAIVGAGKRGEAYAEYATKHPEQLKVVAIAKHAKVADAVAICTQDRLHLLPVEVLAPKGYAILLEKPMSPDPEECKNIIACIKQHGNLFAVCHVLLYTELTQKLDAVLDSGAIGDIVSGQHFEPVA